MAHWRKPHHPTSQFNSVVVFGIGGAVLISAMVLVGFVVGYAQM